MTLQSDALEECPGLWAAQTDGLFLHCPQTCDVCQGGALTQEGTNVTHTNKNLRSSHFSMQILQSCKTQGLTGTGSAGVFQREGSACTRCVCGMRGGGRWLGDTEGSARSMKFNGPHNPPKYRHKTKPTLRLVYIVFNGGEQQSHHTHRGRKT